MGNTNKIKLIQVEEMKNIKLNYNHSDQAKNKEGDLWKKLKNVTKYNKFKKNRGVIWSF